MGFGIVGNTNPVEKKNVEFSNLCIHKTDLIVQITPRIITEGDSGIKQNLYHKLTEDELMKFNIDEKALKELNQMEENIEDILK